MSKLFIHIINSEFSARDEGAEYGDAQIALSAGIQSAAALALDEVTSGKTSTAFEVRVEQASGTPLLRSIVSLSVSTLLLPPDRTPAPASSR